MTFKKRLHQFGLRFALRSLRTVKVNAKPDAALLSEQRRNGIVALVWALDQDGELLSGELLDQLEKLIEFETVVVVCPPRYFPVLRSQGHFFETLPHPADISRGGISANWDMYLRRRVRRIRENWAPDFEFTVGQSPESYFRSIPESDQT